MDFRGVIVHELGHGIRLTHAAPCGNPMATMCGGGDEADSLLLRTLELDDRSAANNVYLQ